MKKQLLLLTFFFLATSGFSFSQNLQNANWCLGRLTAVNFNTSPPNAPTSGFSNIGAGFLSESINSASVSDANGNLLFYTNGVSVWDKNNLIMPNGTGLYGKSGESAFSYCSNTGQNVIIVPKPEDPNIYYIFTLTDNMANSCVPDNSPKVGFYYSVVDMSRNNCKGDIVPCQKNIPLLNHNGDPIDFDVSSQSGFKINVGKITSTLNQTEDKIWVTFFVLYTESGQLKRYLYSYLVSNIGINGQVDGGSPAPTASTEIDNSHYPFFHEGDDYFGTIKISPDRNYLCDNAAVAVNLFNFNDLTGTVTFSGTVYNSNPPVDNSGFGTEFSPDNSFLYFVTWAALFQNKGLIGEKGYKIAIHQKNLLTKDTSEVIGSFDIELPNTLNNSYIPVGTTNVCDLQLGIDNKIYVGSIDPFASPQNSWLGVINYPNFASSACNFDIHGIHLQSNTTHSNRLPQWVHRTASTPNPTACSSIWPKVYYSDKYPQLLSDNCSNSVYLDFRMESISPNLNHIGSTPPGPFSSNYILHYNQSFSRTDWFRNNSSLSYVLKSGIAQVADYTGGLNYQYVEAGTGLPAAPPPIPTGQPILVEKEPGVFITSSYSNIPEPQYFLNIYSNNLLSDQVTVSGMKCIKFNPLRNTLFVFRQNDIPAVSNQIFIYDLSNNTFSLSQTIALAYTDRIVQVDNLNKIYVIHNGELQIVTATGSYTPVLIPNFTNNNIVAFYSDTYPSMNGIFTSNRCLVGQSSENFLYALDLRQLTQRKILTDNFLNSTNNIIGVGNTTDYLFSGDDVFIAGMISSNSITIGNQQIPFLNTGIFSNFITKFNLNTDFTFKVAEVNKVSNEVPLTPQFNFTLFPNPASVTIRAVFEIKGKIGPDIYSVSIFDQMSNRLLKREKYQLGTDLDISGLKPGIYYIEIINRNGEKSGKSFLKL
ncbi:MAG: T9SS type A sorting domain-containing protein [Chitinophagaceae bacterium]|nr:T9SS type A sorting domain-containing protein [Chitinophagaceae bacterium]